MRPAERSAHQSAHQGAQQARTQIAAGEDVTHARHCAYARRNADQAGYDRRIHRAFDREAVREIGQLPSQQAPKPKHRAQFAQRIQAAPPQRRHDPAQTLVLQARTVGTVRRDQHDLDAPAPQLECEADAKII